MHIKHPLLINLKSLKKELPKDNYSQLIEAQKAWEKYEQTMLDSKATINQVKDAQNGLATALFNTNEYLKSVNTNSSKADKKAAQAALDEMGVLNAKDVVEKQAAYNSHQLAKAKLKSAEASEALEITSLKKISLFV